MHCTYRLLYVQVAWSLSSSLYALLCGCIGPHVQPTEGCVNNRGTRLFVWVKMPSCTSEQAAADCRCDLVIRASQQEEECAKAAARPIAVDYYVRGKPSSAHMRLGNVRDDMLTGAGRDAYLPPKHASAGLRGGQREVQWALQTQGSGGPSR